MKRASSDKLDALHGLLAEAQLEELGRALEASRLAKTDQNYRPLDTKLLAVIIKFLKDNGIDAPASSPRMSNLLEQLQNIDVDELPAN